MWVDRVLNAVIVCDHDGQSVKTATAVVESTRVNVRRGPMVAGESDAGAGSKRPDREAEKPHRRE